MYSYNHLFYRQSPFFLQCVCLVCNRLLRHSFPFSRFFQFLTKFNHRSAISCVIHFIRAHILSAGHIRKASAPTLMTSSHVRNGNRCRKSLTAGQPLWKATPAPSITCSTGWSTVPPAGSPCRCDMKRSVEPERTGSPARCGSRLIRHTISARPTTGWVRTPVPAIKSRQGICTIWCWRIYLSLSPLYDSCSS